MLIISYIDYLLFCPFPSMKARLHRPNGSAGRTGREPKSRQKNAPSLQACAHPAFLPGQRSVSQKQIIE